MYHLQINDISPIWYISGLIEGHCWKMTRYPSKAAIHMTSLYSIYSMSLYHLRKELALPSQPRPISSKSKWNWHHDCSQAPEQCASPSNTHTLEHLCCEKWEPSSDGGTKNDIGSNGRRSPITDRVRYLTNAAKHIWKLTVASRHQQDS